MKTRIGYIWLCATLMFVALSATAQTTLHVVSGVVRDDATGRKLPQASVMAVGSHEATVTNADGFFTLKTAERPSAILVSCLGYNSVRVLLDGADERKLKIRLQPGTITLSEVIVSAMNPNEIVAAAVSKIPSNFSHDNEMLRCFYRETTQKGRRYIYVAEAVTNVWKHGYNRLTGVDRVSIEKGRRLVNVRVSDTLGAKIQGGPTLPVDLDLMKNTDMLLHPEELALYTLRMEVPVSLGGRPQIVISFQPAFVADHVLYFGKMYIDRQTLAFTRIEMSLDMRDEDRATAAILLRKPAGVRFHPRSMDLTVAYSFDGRVSRMHYVHTDVRFTCEWRKKLFASPYHVEAEMVVTDMKSDDGQRITAREAFRNNTSFFDKVEMFDDPDFWADYNIIEPSESLEHAIGRIKRNRH